MVAGNNLTGQTPVGNNAFKQDSKDDCENNDNKVNNKRKDHNHDTYKRTYKNVVCGE